MANSTDKGEATLADDVEAQRYQRAAEIFLSACEKSADDRDGYIQHACGGDGGLLQKVRAMLLEDAETGLGELSETPNSNTDRSPSRSMPPAHMVPGYEILDRLGEGGMGVVWKARQASTNRLVALKLLHPMCFGSVRARARFEREVELAARLHHPHIAQVFDSGVAGDMPFYAMQWIDGLELTDYVENAHLDVRQILELFSTICQAVQHAHGRGVIHRDLKPSNILVTEDGSPSVLDFGLAKTLLDEGPRSLELSMAGQIVGTPAYMSPEQAASKQVDTRTDVYSLGVMLYRLLTGKSPREFKGDPAGFLQRVANEEIRPPRESNPNLDADLDALLRRALAQDPEDRYPTAGELDADIRRYLHGEPLQARSPTAVYILRKQLRKHRVPVTLALLAVFALVAGVGFYIGSIRAEQQRTEQEKNKALIAERDAREKADAESEARREADRQATMLAAQRAELLRKAGRTDEASLWLARALVRLPDNEPQRERALRSQLARVLEHRVEFVAGLHHATSVQTVDLSPDGKLAASGSHDHFAGIWDVASGERRGDWLRHQGPVYHVVFSPDGTLLATASDDKKARIWNVETGEQETEPLEHDSVVWRVAFHPNGKLLATAGMDGKTRLWDVATGKPVSEPIVLGATVRDVAFSPDGNNLLSAGWVGVRDPSSGSPIQGGRLIVTDVETGEVQFQQVLRLQLARALFSPDSKYVLASFLDGSVVLWDIETGQMVSTPVRHRAAVTALAFHPQSNSFATGSVDGYGQLWRIQETAKSLTQRVVPVGPRMRYERSLWGLAFSPNGRVLVTAGTEQSVYHRNIRLWNAHTGEPISEQLIQPGPSGYGAASAVKFSSDGRTILVGTDDGAANLWRLHSSFDPDQSTPLAEGITNLLYDQNRQIGLTLFGSTAGQFRDLQTGKPRGPRIEFEGLLHLATLAADGTRVTTVVHDDQYNTQIRVWNPDDGSPRTPPRPVSGMPAVGIRADGKVAAVVEVGPPTVKLWNLADNTAKFEVANASKSWISPDESLLYVLQGKQWLRYATADGQPGSEPIEVGEATVSMSVGRDRVALVAPEQDHVRILNAATGQQIGEAIALETKSPQLAFDPQFRRLAALDRKNRQLWMWDLTTGQLLGEPHTVKVEPGSEETTDFRGMAFSADGSTLVLIHARQATEYVSQIVAFDGATGALKSGPASLPFLHDFGGVSSDGRLVAIGDYKRLRLHDVSTGKQVGKEMELDASNWQVQCLFTESGLLAYSTKPLMKLFDLQGRLLAELRNPANCAGAAVSPDGKVVVSESLDGTIRRWDARTGRLLGQSIQTEGLVSVGAIQDAGAEYLGVSTNYLAVASRRREIVLLDLDSGEPTGQRIRTSGEAAWLHFSPNGKYLAAEPPDAAEGNLEIWNVESGQLVLRAATSRPFADVASFHPTRELVAYTEDRTRLRIRDLASGDVVSELSTLGDVRPIFSPDGRWLVVWATSIQHQQVSVWDLEQQRYAGPAFNMPLTGNLLKTGLNYRLSPDARSLQIYNMNLDDLHVRISRDGRTLLLQGRNQFILMDTATGLPLGPVVQTPQVAATQFDASGDNVLTVSTNALNTWKVGQGVEGSADRILTWLQLRANRTLDESGGLSVLDDAAVAELREKLTGLGGPIELAH